MPNNALYVYGIVRFDFGFNLNETGIDGQNVYLVDEGRFSALVHDCEEKPYTAENMEKIKEFILSHNQVLDKAMENFKGVIPLPFNTIIAGGGSSALSNLKKWLKDDQERLEKIWHKVEGKKEYGLRIYYEKDKLKQAALQNKEVKKLEKAQQGKGEGLSYLLQGKVNSKIQEIFHEEVNKLKLDFLKGIKRITEDVVANSSRLSLQEEKELLLSLSVLGEEKETRQIETFLEKKKDFSFHLAGPFAPYSFVESE